MRRPVASIGNIAGNERSRERLRGIAYMAAGVFVFSIMDSLMKRLSAHYGPLQISFLRCISSLLFLLLPITWRRMWGTLRPSNPPLHLFRAVLGIGMLWGFVFAVHRLSLAQTYALFLAAPLLMTALSVPIHGEKVTAKRWLAIIVGLSGVLIILQPWGISSFSMIAASAAALATICYSLSVVTVRTLGRGNSSMSMVFWYLLLVSIGSGILSLGDWRPVLAADWGWLVGVGVTGALGQMWLTEAFSRAPPSVVGPFEYTSILWAFAIDWIFWSAAPSLSLILGACIVIASGIVVIIDEHRLGRLSLGAAIPPP
ncbi:MAG TPA: DMT family transporter [Steroidobacteraceae bacterium]|nr:DMT family transporter [Steroidobacteraceae bacterium]